MPTATAHANELDLHAGLVRRLLAAQFPRWADLPPGPVPSIGTVNAIWCLGAGIPGEGYPWPWCICRWLPGRNPALVQAVTHLRYYRESRPAQVAAGCLVIAEVLADRPGAT